jgi:hypothetical protein
MMYQTGDGVQLNRTSLLPRYMGTKLNETLGTIGESPVNVESPINGRESANSQI